MKLNTIENLKKRKSNYNLNKDIKVSDEDIIKMVEDVFLYSPSAFNSQSHKAIIVLGDEHDYLWEDLTLNTLLEIVKKEEKIKEVTEKMNSFKNAYGTILIFEDEDIVKSLQEQFPIFKDNFPIWSEQGSGMATIEMWNAFAEMGLGANLQHYNPLIDEKIQKRWDIPKNWVLRGQLIFGEIVEEAKAKEKIDIKKRVKVVK
ncbi:nitroreductase family protein [Peptoniphilus stercorisuis]|uniref:Oxidoreductase (Fatty acid repression mutant protein) n=1 Tax=Peptoniphilus stercorisuis TaxID=1436965 RepID=A0ABS4KDB0_9FIRM|nr:nitroreductase family protein [Peptoniphilus stercorisuis]MBP2025767.1 putative oxidoreductase (fatty acid repression mutant protein) [Peptoniphilus stercorisuis]